MIALLTLKRLINCFNDIYDIYKKYSLKKSAEGIFCISIEIDYRILYRNLKKRKLYLQKDKY